MKEHIVIIGASAAGLSAAREIRVHNKTVGVTLITEEPRLPYYRPMLTEFIGDSSVESKSAFWLSRENWFAENDVTLRTGEKAVGADMTAGKVITDTGAEYSFSKLILASGSVPFVPIGGALNRKNVFAVRTYEDASRVFEYSRDVRRAVVVGGGLLGLEAASSLHRKGIAVTIIELSDRILPRQLDPEASAFLEEILRSAGADLLLGEQVETIDGDDVAQGVTLKSGKKVPADMIIFSIGIRSNVDLAKHCGVEINRAVVVNSYMETSVSGVFACGDVAEFNGRTPALWMPAVRQGKVAGANAAGAKDEFKEEVYPAVLNSYGTRIFSTGDFCQDASGPGAPSPSVIKSVDPEKKNFRKLFFTNGVLSGLILIGDISQSQKLLQALKNGMTQEEAASL